MAFLVSSAEVCADKAAVASWKVALIDLLRRVWRSVSFCLVVTHVIVSICHIRFS